MRKFKRSSKILKINWLSRYEGTLFIMLIFFIDCLTGSWLEIVGTPSPRDHKELSEQLILFLSAKGWFVLVPYLMILVMMFRVLKFDIFDILLTTVCILSVIITQWDYYNNGTSRETGLDWSVFITIFIFIMLLKFSWKKLQKVIYRTRP